LYGQRLYGQRLYGQLGYLRPISFEQQHHRLLAGA
jgi:hypothetical protein